MRKHDVWLFPVLLWWMGSLCPPLCCSCAEHVSEVSRAETWTVSERPLTVEQIKTEVVSVEEGNGNNDLCLAPISPYHLPFSSLTLSLVTSEMSEAAVQGRKSHVTLRLNSPSTINWRVAVIFTHTYDCVKNTLLKISQKNSFLSIEIKVLIMQSEPCQYCIFILYRMNTDESEYKQTFNDGGEYAIHDRSFCNKSLEMHAHVLHLHSPNQTSSQQSVGMHKLLDRSPLLVWLHLLWWHNLPCYHSYFLLGAVSVSSGATKPWQLGPSL